MLRRRAGLTQQALADEAKMSLGGLRDLEQGRVAHPRAATLRRLAAVFGLSPEETRELIWLGQEDPLLNRELQIRVLGVLAVRVDGVAVDLVSQPQRVLLGALALSAGEPVRIETLVELVWGHQPPPTAVDLVRSQISRLRRKLRSTRSPGKTSGVLVATGNGYLLSGDHTQLDHLAFRFLVDRARQDRANQRLKSAFSAYQRAVEVWRGSPLDDLPALQADPAVAALERQQQAAILEYADTARMLGRHEDVLPMLHSLTEANPLHEPAHSRLMIALAGLGRQAEALQVFNALRDRLVNDLGLDPVTELREVHQAILRGDLDGSYLAVPVATSAPEVPAPRTPAPAITVQEPLVPTQLPAGPRGFVGREAQAAALEAVRPAGRRLPDMTTVVISGTAGAGKTALAAHWARQVAHEFPDGQLYADLGGFGPAPAPAQPTDVLRGFLEALGVPADRLPAGLADRAALYRSWLAGKRTLVVLDNARDADQVRSLLPGSPGCLVLVTSRHMLTSLVVIEAAQSVTVDAMTPGEARALLTQRLGPHRTAPDAHAVDVVAERCARLPLALAIASARVATSPALALSTFADQLTADTVLDALRADGPTTDLRTVFSWSYRALSPDAARLFVLLGARARSEVDLATVAELAGESVDQVIPALAELTYANLVRELPFRRFAMHDLLRAYAAELAASRSTGRALQGVA